MLSNVLPDYFLKIISYLPIDKINEIRLRVSKKAIVTIGNKSYYIGQEGLTAQLEQAISVNKDLVEDIVKKVCENSVYAYNNQIKNGFITAQGGIRIGFAGEVVYENDCVKTIKNINSLAIRIPHQIVGCSLHILPFLFQNKFLNTLIVSPPGAGKTTLIRDILFQLSKRGYCYNVLVADERYEIANCFNGQSFFEVGNFCDVLSGSSKKYAFENGIRSMHPDIIVTDEISNIDDYNSILYASSCGVKLLASIHAENIDDLKSKLNFEILLQNKVFDRIVVLSQKEGPGSLEGIYDGNLRYINI